MNKLRNLAPIYTSGEKLAGVLWMQKESHRNLLHPHERFPLNGRKVTKMSKVFLWGENTEN